jgi:mRNA interferase RelE/StbE
MYGVKTAASAPPPPGPRSSSVLSAEYLISRSAAKSVTGLEKPVRRKGLAAIEALAENPHSPSCKKPVGQDAWRIRVANTYRVIYKIHDQVLLVIMVDVGHRREIYRCTTLSPGGDRPVSH